MKPEYIANPAKWARALKQAEKEGRKNDEARALEIYRKLAGLVYEELVPVSEAPTKPAEATVGAVVSRAPRAPRAPRNTKSIEA